MTIQCPKSIISAQSKAFLDHFRLWNGFGRGMPLWVDAKTAEALLVLSEALREEEQSGKTQKDDH